MPFTETTSSELIFPEQGLVLGALERGHFHPGVQAACACRGKQHGVRTPQKDAFPYAPVSLPINNRVHGFYSIFIISQAVWKEMGHAKALITHRKKWSSINGMDGKFPYAQKMIIALDQGIATDLKLHDIISWGIIIMGIRSNKALQI